MDFGNFAGGMAKGLSALPDMMMKKQALAQQKELGGMIAKAIEGKGGAEAALGAIALDDSLSGLLSLTKPSDGENPDFLRDVGYKSMARGLPTVTNTTPSPQSATMPGLNWMQNFKGAGK